MLIVLLGWRGSGKDTFAEYLINNYSFTKFAFADGVKDITSELYNIPRELFDDPIKKNEKYITFSPRDACIHIGQSVKKLDPYIWINRVINKMKMYEKCVISDCRFPNELEKVKEIYKDCYTIWIDRYNEIPEECKNEESENSLNHTHADYIISNKKEFNDFYKEIDKFIEKIN